jgi:chloramphenicol O-acetyltransferase type A
LIHIDLETWERRQHYRLFKDYLNPYFSICAPVDITRLVEDCRRKHTPFFAAFLYCVMKVLNRIPEFRYRIRLEGVVFHEVVHPSYTVMTEEKLFRFVTTPFSDNRDEFITRVLNDIETSKKTVSLEDVEGVDDLVYVSSLKWVSFTEVSHPYDNKRPDSFPRITWGKYEENNGKVLFPVSVMAHHALCDGEHAGTFYQRLQEEVNRLD